MIDPEHIPHFLRIVERWNKAETALKKAEGNLTFAQQPAINELRYAGRRIVDALAICLHRHGEDVSAHSDGDIGRVLLEAEQNCIKAEHDVADAIILYVHKYVNTVVEEFGELDVSTHFPNYFTLKTRITKINEFVTSSRGQRGERADIYDEILSDYIPDLSQLYEELRGAQGVIRLQKERRLANEKKQRIMRRIAIAALIMTIIGVAATVILANAPET